MQLREKINLPNRYREPELVDLPPNPRFVVPTIAFNPNIRPACFPTLAFDELSPDHPNYIAKGHEREGREERPAIVFRDPRIVPAMNSQQELESETGLVRLGDGSWVATDDPGEYDGYTKSWDEDIGGEQQERWHLPSLSQQKYWSDLSNGMQLIVVRELTAHMSFGDAVLFLCLEEKELEDFLNLCVDEIKIRRAEDSRMKRTEERQMAMLDVGDWSADGNEWSRIFDEEMLRDGQPTVPATLFITREEVAIAKNFMGNFRFREEFPATMDENFHETDHIPTFAVLSAIQDRLEDYVGVGTTFNDLDFGEDFLEYLPTEVLVIEEVRDGVTVETAWDIPDDLAPLHVEGHYFARVQAPVMTSANSRPSSDKSTTKGTEENGLTGLDLLKKSRRVRPPKPDKIIKAPPTRLREVMNAEDFESCQPSSTSTNNTPAATNAPKYPESPETLNCRSVHNVGRNPFKEHSPSTPPPVHSASFRDSIPAQPAPTSPPKISKTSPLQSTKAGPSAANIQQAPNFQLPSSKFQLASSVQSTIHAQSAAKSQTETSDRLVPNIYSPVDNSTSCDSCPAGVLAVPKSSMIRRYSSSSAFSPEPQLDMGDMKRLEFPEIQKIARPITPRAARPLDIGSVASSSSDTVSISGYALSVLNHMDHLAHPSPRNPASKSANLYVLGHMTQVSPPKGPNITSAFVPASEPDTTSIKGMSLDNNPVKLSKIASASTLKSSIAIDQPRFPLDQPDQPTLNTVASATASISVPNISSSSTSGNLADEVPRKNESSNSYLPHQKNMASSNTTKSASKFIPYKIKFTSRKHQAGRPNMQPDASPSSLREYSPGKRNRDEEATPFLSKAQIAKKPCLEQPNLPTQTFVGSMIGRAKSLKNKMFNGNPETNLAGPSTADYSNSNDVSEGIVALPDVATPGRLVDQINDFGKAAREIDQIAARAEMDLDEPKKLRASRVSEEKTRSAARDARRNSQSSIESVDIIRVNNSTQDLSTNEITPNSSNTKVELQILVKKRAALESSSELSKKEGSPAKKTKTGETSFAGNRALQANARGSQKRGSNSKILKKATAQSTSTSQVVPETQNGESSSSAASIATMSNPGVQPIPASPANASIEKTVKKSTRQAKTTAQSTIAQDDEASSSAKTASMVDPISQANSGLQNKGANGKFIKKLVAPTQATLLPIAAVAAAAQPKKSSTKAAPQQKSSTTKATPKSKAGSRQKKATTRASVDE